MSNVLPVLIEYLNTIKPRIFNHFEVLGEDEADAIFRH